MDIISKYYNIKKNILILNKIVNLVVVTKSQSLDHIKKLINLGHLHFGENKVQDAKQKWLEYKKVNNEVKLHMIGGIQSNKVKDIVKIFDYVHSIDSQKIVEIFKREEVKQNKNLYYFIQVNLANEEQKSGVNINKLDSLVNFCKELKLNLIGLMCIPPVNQDPVKYFIDLKKISLKYNLHDLSMGMSSDYISAIKCGSTFIRVGSAIFSEN